MSRGLDFKHLKELLEVDKPEPELLEDLDILLGFIVFFGPLAVGLPSGTADAILCVLDKREGVMKAGKWLFTKLSKGSAGDQVSSYRRAEKAAVLLPYVAFAETVRELVPAIKHLPENVYENTDSFRQTRMNAPEPPSPALNWGPSLDKLSEFYETYIHVLQELLEPWKVLSQQARPALLQLEQHRDSLAEQAKIRFIAEDHDLRNKFELFKLYREQQEKEWVARILVPAVSPPSEAQTKPVDLLRYGSSLLQPRFGSLFGTERRRQSAELADSLEQQFFGIYYVHGAPGMGKSELCRAAIRAYLERHATARAVKIDLRQATDRRTFLECCARSTGAKNEAAWEEIVDCVRKLVSPGRLIVLFENMEVIANDSVSVADVVSLTGIDGVSVVASSQADLGPAGRGIFVTRLDTESACELFVSCWKRNQKAPELASSEELADFIEGRLSNHPLSIILTAGRGGTYRSLAALIQEWGSKQSALRTPLQETLHRCLESLSKDEYSFLMLVALFSIGMPAYAWEHFVGADPGLWERRRRVSEWNLIEEPNRSRTEISMLLPIADHVLDTSARNDAGSALRDACARALVYFCGLAREARDPDITLYEAMIHFSELPPLGEGEGSTVTSTVAEYELSQEFGQILTVLDAIAVEEAPSLRAQLSDLALHLRKWCARDFTYGERVAGRINVLCRVAGDEIGQAHSYFALGTAVRDKTESIRNLEQAEHLYRSTGFRLGLADALLKLHDRDKQSVKREARIEEAARLYSECSSWIGQFLVAVSRHQRDRAAEADAYFTSNAEAIDRFRQGGDRGQLAKALLINADHETFVKSRHEAARDNYREAAHLFASVGDQRGHSESLFGAGRAAFELNQIEDAERELEDAVEVLESAPDARTLAYVQLYLGLAANHRGDQARSTAFLEQACATGASIGIEHNIRMTWILKEERKVEEPGEAGGQKASL